MSKQAILVVSFGTTVEQARAAHIGVVEREVGEAFSQVPLYRAYTSPTVRRVLAGRGVQVPDLATALDELAGAGVERLRVLPTHLLPGIEYDRITRTAARFAPRFQRLALARPLMGDTQGLRQLAGALMRHYPVRAGRALILLGHGTCHPANVVYPALQGILHMAGRTDMLVGTVEGWPDCPAVLEQLEGMGRPQVTLAPLMLTAGEHALADMAGPEPDSWSSRLGAAGFPVECLFDGLGSIPGVRALYCRRLEELGE